MELKKRFLSYVLAGTCFCSPAKKEEIRSMEVTLGVCVAVVLLGGVGYLIYSAYKEEQERKAEINRRNTLLCFSSCSERISKIASQLVHKIPCSPIGNSMFDSLLSCKNEGDITTWSALVAANSDWDSSTLDSICNTVLAFGIQCDVLKDKVKTKRQEEQENAKLNLEKEKLLQTAIIENQKIYSKEKIANKKIDSKERENEKDRRHDTDKQIRQQIHEHSMQDKQHCHEEDMNYPKKHYNYY